MNDPLDAFTRDVLALHGRPGDPARARVANAPCLQRGDLGLAASALDHAWGHAPYDEALTHERAALLERLSVREHGLVFRYVPAGRFVMGTDDGETDEGPQHVSLVDAYWIADVPMTWAAYCDLMGWKPPPHGRPRVEPDDAQQRARFFLGQANNIRLQYCESETRQARGWHTHVPPEMRGTEPGQAKQYDDFFGKPRRENPNRPWSYDEKPMIAVAYQDAEPLCERLSQRGVRYALPTEAQWEKAARGGLNDTRYAWGDAPPSPDRCDSGRFGDFRLRVPREFPPNGYGIYGMCGGVWEWTADEYDALAYRPDAPPAPPDAARERTLRGGSWSDCEDVVRLTYRMSRPSEAWWDEEWGDHLSPTIGFRIVRMEG